MDPIVIDCCSCVARHTSACEDCVVTYVCGREAEDALVIDVDEFRALRLLHKAGLVPGLRHKTGT